MTASLVYRLSYMLFIIISSIINYIESDVLYYAKMIPKCVAIFETQITGSAFPLPLIMAIVIVSDIRRKR